MAHSRPRIRIPHRSGLVHEGELVTTGHPCERLPPEERQVLVAWWKGPNAGTSGWVAWELVAPWVQP